MFVQNRNFIYDMRKFIDRAIPVSASYLFKKDVEVCGLSDFLKIADL